MATEAEMTKHQKSGEVVVVRHRPSGTDYEGRVVGRDDSVVSTPTGAEHPWTIREENGTEHSFPLCDVDVLAGFEVIQWHIERTLIHLRGDAEHAYRESLLNDMVSHGYSRARAEQVIDEETKRSRARHGVTNDA